MRTVLLKNMPPVNGFSKLERTDAINQDIITAIHSNYPEAVKQCKNIAQSFVGANRLQTCFNVWKWLKSNIHYVRDVKGSQMVKLPNRFLSDGSGDCKSYSLFTAGILGALKIPFSFRYTSYIPGSNIPTHIYCITTDENNNPIIIDAVYKGFNTQKAFEFKKDYPMNVYTLSGFEDSVNGISEDDIIGALINTCSPDEIKSAHRAIRHITNKTGVYGPDEMADIGSLKSAAKKVANVVKKPVQAVAKKVVQAVKKVVAVEKKVYGAAPRAAYLLLIRNNVHGFATKVLSKRNDKNLKNRWENLGGNFSELIKNAEIGAKKKSIFGVGAIAVAATLASAAAIVSALAPILGKGEAPAPATPASDSSTGSNVADFIKKATPFIKKTSSLIKNAQAAKTNVQNITKQAEQYVPATGSFLSKIKRGNTAQPQTTAPENYNSPGSSSGYSSQSSNTQSSPAQTDQFETPDRVQVETGKDNTMLYLGLGALALFALTSK